MSYGIVRHTQPLRGFFDEFSWPWEPEQREGVEPPRADALYDDCPAGKVKGYDQECYDKDFCPSGVPMLGRCVPVGFCKDGACGAFVAGGSSPGPATVQLPTGQTIGVTVQPDGTVVTQTGLPIGTASGGQVVASKPASSFPWGKAAVVALGSGALYLLLKN